jgi:hypothetical protein
LSLGIAGLGLSLTGPVFGSVIATISLVVGAAGALLTLLQSILLLRKDDVSMQRMLAIEHAQEVLADRVRQLQ